MSLAMLKKSVIKTMAGLIAQDRTSFAETDLVRNDMVFFKSLNLDNVYAPETNRIYLDRLTKNQVSDVIEELDEINIRHLKSVKLTSIETTAMRYMPVDIDVSPMDNSRTKKEGVGRTYKGCDGYAPIFSYVGREGYMLSTELRPGKQHCQKGTPAYLSRTLLATQSTELSGYGSYSDGQRK